jgi:hypothetical protein
MDIIIPRESDLKKLSKADQKSHVRRNKHFFRWIKENCCCKRCGERFSLPKENVETR